MNRGSLIFFNDLSFPIVDDTILCHPIRRPVNVVKAEKSNKKNTYAWLFSFKSKS